MRGRWWPDGAAGAVGAGVAGPGVAPQEWTFGQEPIDYVPKVGAVLLDVGPEQPHLLGQRLNVSGQFTHGALPTRDAPAQDTAAAAAVSILGGSS